eukprot:GEMP01009503.1.p1 GENE.GEMP01009503.1~~GEMP01009503.1.p1  ORF type:complete len:273 (+),score=81.71 GEMP01009503.1:1127-1945(+)
MAASVTLPLQVLASGSQVAFVNGGPVLNLGLTLQIPVNDLIEALLAYQTHYEKNASPSSVPQMAKPDERAQAGAIATQEQKPSGPPAHGGVQNIVEEHRGAVPAGAQPASPPTWDTDFSTLHRTKGEDYAKKSKWSLDKGFVPPTNKKVEPLQIKNFAVAATPFPTEQRAELRLEDTGRDIGRGTETPPNLAQPPNLPQQQGSQLATEVTSPEHAGAQDFPLRPPGLSPPRRSSGEGTSMPPGPVPFVRRSLASTPTVEGDAGDQEKDCKQQ